jgi:hypothetical protein
VAVAKLHDGLDALLAGHDEIGDDEIAGRGGEQGAARAALLGLEDDVAALHERRGEHGAERFVVFDDEEVGHGDDGAVTLRRTPPGEGRGAVERIGEEKG